MKEPTERHYELALEHVVETVMNHGQWPRHKREYSTRRPIDFDLYEFILEKVDESYLAEMFLAAMSNNTRSFEDRIERERGAMEKMLINHFLDSAIVADYAEELAADDE